MSASQQPAPAIDGALDQVRTILRALARHLPDGTEFISAQGEGDRVFHLTERVTPGLRRAAEARGRSRTPGRRAAADTRLDVPLTAADGTAFGVLRCAGAGSGRGLTTQAISLMRIGADIVSSVLDDGRRTTQDRTARRARILDIMETGALAVVYQPVYRVGDGRLMAFEALSRFPGDPARGPDLWFADAAEVGLGIELELLAVDKALAALPVLGPEINLTFNLSPAAASSGRFADTLAGTPLDRMVIELTEHASVPCYDALRAALAPLRARGLRLAIDDVGAGHSTFRHVLDLAPEFIKLDRSLIHGIDGDMARRALAEALISYARRIGCEVVAEGLETQAEYAVLRDVGITRAQGYLTGRPMCLADAARLPVHCRH